MYSLIDPQPQRRPGWRIALTGAAAASLLAVLLVGPPWALAAFLGWPLPDRVPAVEEVLALLTRPPDIAVVIDVLACVCWVAWAAFVLDVVLAAAQAIGDAASWLRYRRHLGARADAVVARGWRPGAALVGIVLVALLAGTRPGVGPPAAPTPVTQSQPLHTTTAHNTPTLLEPDQAPTEPGDGADDGPAQRWVQVRPPSEGVHDSLWRIADRELGDPTRWPELFDDNAGRPQPDGRALSRPDLIQPGWTLALPTVDSPPPVPGPDLDPREGTEPDATGPGVVADTGPIPSGPGGELPEAAQPTGEPATAGPGTGATGSDVGSEGSTGAGWVEVGPGVAIGVGFAAAVAAAMALSRRGRRRPRDGHRTRREVAGKESFPVLPVVREISRRVPASHPADDRPDDDGSLGTSGSGDPRPGQVPVGPTPATRTPDARQRDRSRRSQARGGNPASAETSARDEAGIAVTPTGPLPPEGPWAALLAVARAGNGLGLAGPGALSAIRALLLELLLCGGREVRIVVAGDLPARLGVDAATLTDLDVSCVEDLPAALVAVADLASRADDTADPTVEAPRTSAVVLAPVPDPSIEPGAVSVLGSPRLVSVLHGPWPAGVTAYARSDGTIAAAGPAAHGDLVGRRLPILDVITATEMLDLAADVEGIAGTDSDDVATTADLIEAARSGSDEPTRSGEENGHTLAPGSEPDDNTGQQVRRWTLQILGRPTLLTCSGGSAGPGRADVEDVTGVLSPRMLELLVYLALHPAGVRRDAAVAALWPDTGRGRPGNNLSSLISRLRAAIRATDTADADSAQPTTDDAARIVIADGDRYQLDPDHIAVDYWTFLTALAAAAPSAPATTTSAGQPDELDRARLVALHTAHNLYRGPLGEGLDSEWILTVREAARRSFLTTTARLVRHHVADDPTTAQQLLETARNLEPTNEKLYRDIIALQLRVGDNDGAAATMRLLESQLADIEETPDGTTRALARLIDGADPGERGGASDQVIPVPSPRQYRRDHGPAVTRGRKHSAPRIVPDRGCGRVGHRVMGWPAV